MTRRRLLTIGLPLSLVLVFAVAALAYFTHAGSGAAAATVGALHAPTNVAVPGSSTGTVAVTWTDSTLSNGSTPATGYYVTRVRNSDSSTANACGTSPVALTSSSATSCNDTGVAAGTYHYTVTAVYHTWTATSGSSGNVTVVPDTTAPTASISFPANAGAYNSSGYAAGCSPAGICGSAADATGVQSVKVSIKRGSDNTYWNGSIFTGTTETFNTATLASPGASSTNWTYAFALPAANTYVVHVQTADTVGNAQTGTTYAATSSFTIDVTAPNAPTFTIPSPIRNGQALTATAVSDNGGGSGVQKVEYFYCPGGSCTPTTSIGSSTTSAGNYLVTWSSQPADGTYRVLARVTDNAGNTADSTIRTTVIDNTAPTLTLTSPASGAFTNDTTPALSGTCTTADGTVTVTIKQGATTIASPTGSCTSGAFNFSSSTLSQGAYTAQASQTDGAGNTGTSAANAFTLDTTAPAVPTFTIPSPIRIGQALTATAVSDTGGSGVQKVEYLYCPGTSCTPVTSVGSSTTSGNNYLVTWSSQPADGSYRLLARVTDNAGNTRDSTNQSTTIDNTAPAVTLTNPANGGATNTATPTLSGAAGNATGDSTTVTVKIYGGSDTTGTLVQTLTPTRSSATWTTTATTLAQGVYTAQATQTDTAGNTGASTANTFTVDTTAPNVPTFTIPSLIRNGQSLTATSVSDAGGSGVQKVEYFWCRTGGACAPATSIGSSTIAGTNYLVTWSGQPADNTNYRLLARVTDVAGNTTDSAIQTTQIDNTAPTVTLTSPASGSFTNSTTPTFTGACTTGDGSVTVTIKQSGTTVQTPTGACGSGTYSATATALPEAAYTAQASQTDAAGNTGTSATNTFTVDTTTPTVSSVALVNHGSTTGRVDASDTIVVTFSEQMKVSSFCSTWVSGDGNNQSLASNNDVTVTLTDGGASNDSISVSSGTCSFNFGTVNLGSTAYITGGTRTFSGSGSSKSSIASDATAHTLTITLGSSDSNGSVATVTSSVATYTPSASIADSAGNSGVAAKSTANVKQF